MELWIRSQDNKRLIKTEYLYLVYDAENSCAYLGDKTAGHIAKYKDEKRALEVFTEIQQKINFLSYVEFCKDSNQLGILFAEDDVDKIKQILIQNIGIYQMPEE